MASKMKASTATAQALRKRIGRYLKTLRERKELTQVEAAGHLGYQYFTFLAQIEQGRSRIPPEDWTAWARLYGVDPQEFAKRLLAHYDPHVYAALFGPGTRETENDDHPTNDPVLL